MSAAPLRTAHYPGRIVPLDPHRAIPRDQAGFEALFHLHYRPLMRYARRLTSDPATASDVLQDVFLKLWEQRHDMKVESSVRALLYTMVRNRALNLKRRERFTADLPPDVADPHAAGILPITGPGADVETLERQISQWIRELPPRRSEAFSLSRFDALSHEEIASVMGISRRTVETHIVLALRELRKRLDQSRIDRSDS